MLIVDCPLLESVGANELEEAETRSTLRLLLEQFSNPLLIILLVGAGVSLYADHVVDAIAITAIVIINALISFAQEFKQWRVGKYTGAGISTR